MIDDRDELMGRIADLEDTILWMEGREGLYQEAIEELEYALVQMVPFRRSTARARRYALDLAQRAMAGLNRE